MRQQGGKHDMETMALNWNWIGETLHPLSDTG
jgi:hypothetical protein